MNCLSTRLLHQSALHIPDQYPDWSSAREPLWHGELQTNLAPGYLFNFQGTRLMGELTIRSEGSVAGKLAEAGQLSNTSDFTQFSRQRFCFGNSVIKLN